MKILKYTYMPLLFFVVLLFCVPAQAATSTVSQSITINSGESISVRGQSFTDLTYDEESVLINTNDVEVYTWTWNLAESISLTNFSTSSYYSGFIYIKLTLTPSNSDIQISDWVLSDSNVTDGVYCYLGQVATNSCTLAIVFDNYLPQRALMGIPTITCKAVNNSQTDNNMTASTDFTLSFGSGTTNLYGYEGVQNNALTAMIYSAVAQATAPELESILEMLEEIKLQDYAYYVQLMADMSEIQEYQSLTYEELIALYNEIDADFEDIQTILDLFPSYRTQVLEYWEQLLEMNAAQSSAAEEMASEVADKDAQSSTLLSGLNSIDFPDIGDIDILSNVDSTQKTNFFGVISTITNNSLITTILLIVVTGAIVGYILYGKK